MRSTSATVKRSLAAFDSSCRSCTKNASLASLVSSIKGRKMEGNHVSCVIRVLPLLISTLNLSPQAFGVLVEKRRKRLRRFSFSLCSLKKPTSRSKTLSASSSSSVFIWRQVQISLKIGRGSCWYQLATILPEASEKELPVTLMNQCRFCGTRTT